MDEGCNVVKVTKKEIYEFFPLGGGMGDENLYIVAKTIADMKNECKSKEITSSTYDYDTSTYFFQYQES